MPAIPRTRHVGLRVLTTIPGGVTLGGPQKIGFALLSPSDHWSEMCVHIVPLLSVSGLVCFPFTGTSHVRSSFFFYNVESL